MKHRAIKNLIPLKPSDFFVAISEGLEKIYTSCESLHRSTQNLVTNKDYHGARVMETIANEEAAKFLILIDAVRCPPNEQKLLSRQLEKFNEHLAKGVYAKMCGWKPDTYSTLCEYIELELKEFYLDGPEGVEWIFRNSIIAEREEAMYVDYVEYKENQHTWLTPMRFCDTFVASYDSPIKMVKALYLSGVSSVAALKAFSEYWRNFQFTSETHYQDFRDGTLKSIQELDEKGLIKEASEDNCILLINELPFPAYREAMKIGKVSMDDLKDVQNNWYPQ